MHLLPGLNVADCMVETKETELILIEAAVDINPVTTLLFLCIGGRKEMPD